MSDPVQLVLSRLDNPRANGKDRWRSACPACGGTNRSALSIGAGDTGCVLLKCFKEGCGPDQIAAALGLELEDLFPLRESSGRPLQRRRLISANQALDVLDAEITLAFVCAADMGQGKQLDDVTRERLTLAAARIAMIRDEVRA